MSLRSKALKFIHLSHAEQGMIISAYFLLIFIRISLAVFSFEHVRGILSFLMREKKTHDDVTWEEKIVDGIVWAVTTASRYLPFEINCFPRALATHVLLRRRNMDTELKIGISKSKAEEIEAHAWVVCEGRVIMGDLDDLERFSPLGQLDKKLL
jgi:hypothetical protein